MAMAGAIIMALIARHVWSSKTQKTQVRHFMHRLFSYILYIYIFFFNVCARHIIRVLFEKKYILILVY
jgi:hypothetical protein